METIRQVPLCSVKVTGAFEGPPCQSVQGPFLLGPYPGRAPGRERALPTPLPRPPGPPRCRRVAAAPAGLPDRDPLSLTSAAIPRAGRGLEEQFVEKTSCAQPLGDLPGLGDSHGDFGGSLGGGGGCSPSSLCTEPLIPTTPIVPSEEMAKIACSLETKELWDKFHELGTEMIITKSGRGGN